MKELLGKQLTKAKSIIEKHWKQIKNDNADLTTERDNLFNDSLKKDTMYKELKIEYRNVTKSLATLQEKVQALESNHARVNGELQAVKTRLQTYDGLMVLPFMLNVANQLWNLTARGMRTTHFDGEVIGVLAKCLGGTPNTTFIEQLRELRHMRNHCIHDIRQVLKDTRQIQSDPAFLAKAANECPVAALLVENAEPLALYVLASEIVQLCKYRLSPRGRWEDIGELCIQKLVRGLNQAGVSIITEEDVETMFGAFTTRENEDGYPEKPAHRVSIVACMNEWWQSGDTTTTEALNLVNGQTGPVLEMAVHLLTASEEV